MSAQLQEMASFRPMSLQDVEAVVAVESAIYAFPWSYGNFRDSLHSGYSCWVYEYGGELVGYAVMMVAVGEAHLLNLGISSDWQGKGMGRRFLLYLMELAREYHADSMFLEVRPSNFVARRLYATEGFMEIAVRKKYYPAEGGGEDAIMMERVL